MLEDEGAGPDYHVLEDEGTGPDYHVLEDEGTGPDYHVLEDEGAGPDYDDEETALTYEVLVQSEATPTPGEEYSILHHK